MADRIIGANELEDILPHVRHRLNVGGKCISKPELVGI